MTLLDPTIDTLDSDDADSLLKVSVPSIPLRVSLASLLLSGVLGADLRARFSQIGNTGVFFSESSNTTVLEAGSSLGCHFVISKHILRAGLTSSTHACMPKVRSSPLLVLLTAGLDISL